MDTGQKKTATDSTKSRDHHTDQQILPVTTAPEMPFDSKTTNYLFQQNHIDEICSVVTYVADDTHIVPTFPNLPVTISTLQISVAPILY